MYICAKFVTNHIFLQNREKINIKNSGMEMGEGRHDGRKEAGWGVAVCWVAD
jgi:hypothetical protein